jgi:hypothetical protein
MNKIVVLTSLVLNGILLMVLFGILPFLFYVSVLLNLGMLWFVFTMVSKNAQLEEDIINIVEKIEDFSSHIDEIHGLEMYYGDEDLQGMIDHSRRLINDFIDFQAEYFDVEIEEPDEEEEN